MTQTLAWRKTKGGTWAIQGPTDIIRPGATVMVTRRNGERSSETIESVGRSFTLDGVETVYGYPTKTGRTEGTERCYQGHTSPQRGCHDCFDLWDM